MKSYIDQNKLRNIFLDENGTGVYNHKTIENKFNDYFTNVTKRLLENMGETSNKFQD